MSRLSFYEKQKRSFVDSIMNINFNNIISILCDVGIIISWFITGALFNNILGNTFGDLEQLAFDFLDRSTFYTRATMMILGLGMMLLTFILFIAAYSLFNGITWLRFSNKKITLYKLWAYFKQNSIYGFFGLVMVYLIRLLFVDKVWEFIALFFIIIFIWMLPVMHIRTAIVPEGKRISNIWVSFNEFKNYFHHFFVVGLISLVLVSVITTLPAILSGGMSEILENVFLILLSLFSISWVRSYHVEMMRYIGK